MWLNKLYKNIPRDITMMGTNASLKPRLTKVGIVALVDVNKKDQAYAKVTKSST
jgi:hypothetical protein